MSCVSVSVEALNAKTTYRQCILNGKSAVYGRNRKDKYPSDEELHFCLYIGNCNTRFNSVCIQGKFLNYFVMTLNITQCMRMMSTFTTVLWRVHSDAVHVQ